MMSDQVSLHNPARYVLGGLLPVLREHNAREDAAGTVMPFCSETCREAGGGTSYPGLNHAAVGWMTVDDFGYTPHCEECGCEIRKGERMEPHEMTLGQFRASSKAERLHNHGRKWSVIMGSQALGFSDADTEEAAIADMHCACVSNAVYLNAPGAPDLGADKPSLPPAEVLADYPELMAKLPEMGLSVPVQHSPEVLELIAAAKSLADLLDDEHPAGSIFNLEVHADDVARLKSALLALGQ